MLVFDLFSLIILVVLSIIHRISDTVINLKHNCNMNIWVVTGLGAVLWAIVGLVEGWGWWRGWWA